MDQMELDTQIVSATALINQSQGKFSKFFYRFTVPSLLLVFALGVLLIFGFMNYQQNNLIHEFTAQEEALHSEIANSETSRGMLNSSTRLLFTQNIFNKTREGLQDTFLVLVGSLSLYLGVMIFVSRKLKQNAKQLETFVSQLQGMNEELQLEINKRDEMAQKLEELNTELKYLSLHDTLTKLPNRRLFEDRLVSTIEASKRNKRIFAVMFLDLDGFKLINDTVGHDYGDELLKAVARLFSGLLRSTDTVARFGGDEFAIILADLDKPESAAYAAERIIKLIREPVIVKEQSLKVNVSIGITLYPNDSDSAQILLKNADVAMYQAKSLGPGNFQFYREDMNMESRRNLLLRNSLPGALENGLLEMYYQPIVDVNQHAIIHFEALLRWNHPQLGFISPLEILETASNLHLLIPLEEWIFEKVCTQIQTWETAGMTVPPVCVNVSPFHIDSVKYVQKLKESAITKQVKMDSIILEVTESMLIKNFDATIKTFHELNDLGIKIAIDDFGTGYSSLNYIRLLPIQIIKIDQSFIKGLQESASDVAIVRAVMALAKALSLEVIAEGVETQAQKEILQSLGCNKMQGYYFGKPAPAESCLNISIPSKS
jgi:diguanylate cyclase (GGDEF)-like protein